MQYEATKIRAFRGVVLILALGTMFALFLGVPEAVGAGAAATLSDAPPSQPPVFRRIRLRNTSSSPTIVRLVPEEPPAPPSETGRAEPGQEIEEDAPEPPDLRSGRVEVLHADDPQGPPLAESHFGPVLEGQRIDLIDCAFDGVTLEVELSTSPL